ncbi:MAG: tandem-95 repeat protein, partial [Vitreoscilla sp.]|nr:tandem-95 repeat protein [Vitreoscilla sp.]
MSSSPSVSTPPANPAGAKTIQVSVNTLAASKLGTDAAMQALIAKGYVPARQLAGKVVGTWGEVLVRDAEGHIHPLKAGDVVETGDVVLTGQNGIVQIEGGRSPAAPGELERVIAEVAAGNPDVAPAAGAQGGDGSMQPGLRVDRVAEGVTPASLGTEPFGNSASAAVLNETSAQAAKRADAALPDTVTVAEDAAVTFDPRSNDDLAGTGPATVLTVGGQAIAVGAPVVLPQGTVTLNPDGTLTFTPVPDFNGSFSVPYTASNGGGTVSSTITVTVTPVNDAPSAVSDTNAAANDALVTPEDTPTTIDVLRNDTDPDGDPLTITEIDGQPISPGTPVQLTLDGGQPVGTVSLNPDGTLTFTPAPNYHGRADFDYTVTDGTTPVTAHVTVTVTPVNDAPLAVSDTFEATEGAAFNGDLGNNDTRSGDGGNAFALATAPAHGTVVVNADGTFTYTPAANYNGPDSFTYTLTDADGDVSTATVTLNVGSVDDLPVAANDTFAATEDTTLNGNLGSNDTLSGDGGNTFALGAGPTHGTVVVNADGTFTYTPAANYNGPDSFTYTLIDADGDVSTATVTLNVGSVDDLPVAANDTFAATEDTALNGSLAGNDTLSGDGGNAFALGSGPAHGTVVVNADGTFTYTPAANYNGPDSFTYTLTDADGDVSTATVTLNVGSVDDLPVAANDTFAATEDTVLNGSLGANDTLSGDGGNAFALGTGPAHGTVVVNADGTFTYTPAANYNGPDSFTYTLTDADGDVSTATVTLNVGAVDDLPVASNDTFAATEDTVLSGSLGSNDTLSGDGGNTFALGTGPAHGTVTVNADGTFTYTPAANYNGPDSFTYTLTDADGDVSTATVTLNVGSVDDLPVASNDTFAATEDAVLNGSLDSNDTLSGDGGNTFALATGPAHG